MEKLKTTGKYDVGSEMREKISSQFYGGYCCEDKTKDYIGYVWKNNRYLMDTHTAVGYGVLEEYRKKTGDSTATVIVSTASPYKFADSVVAAAVGEHAEGLAAIDALSSLTCTQPPKPLSGLDKLEVRFKDCIEKADMPNAVRRFLDM